MTRSLDRLKILSDRIGDWLLGIDTMRDPNALAVQRQWRAKAAPRNDDPVRHDPTAYWVLTRVARKLGLRRDDVVFDLGCGTGRAICYLARWPVAKVVGIEFFEPLCEIAERNAARVRGRKAPIEIRCDDVHTADLSEGKVFFLYNPFGAETLQDAVDRIEESLEKKPRRVVVAYYKPLHENVLRSCSHLCFREEFSCITGNRVSIWETPLPA